MAIGNHCPFYLNRLIIRIYKNLKYWLLYYKFYCKINLINSQMKII